MHLRTGIVAVVVAAAEGAAVTRAVMPRPPAAAPLDFASPFASNVAGPVAARGRRAQQPAGGPGAAVVVYVAGAVVKPGVYALHTKARGVDALHAAGGATAQADLVAVNLAAPLEDGEELAVPLRGAGAAVSEAAAAGAPAKRRRRHPVKHGHHRKKRRSPGDPASTADAPTQSVDVNSADEATLETLPGIGPSLAQRIVAFRDLNGPFASSDELLDVGGMTSGKVDALSAYIVFR